jgi:hypothetical protein
MATGHTTNEMTDDELMQFCYLDPSIELIYQTTNKILMDDDDEYISHRLADVLEVCILNILLLKTNFFLCRSILDTRVFIIYKK